MNTTVSSQNKKRPRYLVSLAVLLALILAAGVPLATQQTPAANNDPLSHVVTNMLTMPDAYADGGCDGGNPPPSWECPQPQPTPTSTPTPLPGG